jgi:hypothetical protein
MKLSAAQRTILRTIRDGTRLDRRHCCFREDLHAAVWNHETLRRGSPGRWQPKQSGTPLNASHRASLCRSIKRLVRQGMVIVTHGTVLELTASGLEQANG